MTPEELRKLCDSQRGDEKRRASKVRFLQALASNGGVRTKAAAAANISAKTSYNWQTECKTFAQAVEAVLDIAEEKAPSVQSAPANTESQDEDIVPDYRKQIEAVCRDVKQGNDQRRTVKAKRRFLRSYYANNVNATAAARQINLSPRTIRDWRKKDPKFVELMEEIEEIFHAESVGEMMYEFKRGNATAMKEVAKGILGWTGESKQQIVINQAVLNPEKSEAEKLVRAREIMEAIGFSVSDDDEIEGEINPPQIEHNR